MPGNKVTEEEAREWKRMYEEDGMTIEGISLETGRGLTTVKIWLNKMNTKMRPASGPVEFIRNKMVDGKRGKGKNETTRFKNYQGHRRRGRY